MAESLVQVTEGSGKKLHTYQRTVGVNNVEDEVTINGEHYLASYKVVATGVSTATINSHVLQIMAGASLHVLVRRIRVFQSAVATAAALQSFSIFRLSTAGTGGTAITPAPLDTGDAASGATAMTLPTVKGTETTNVDSQTSIFLQTITASLYPAPTLVADFDFDRLREKSLRIPAGAANGIAVKNLVAVAGALVVIVADITEVNFV